MPTSKEREYYRMGFIDGGKQALGGQRWEDEEEETAWGRKGAGGTFRVRVKPKRKLSAWNKFVKANSKKPRFRLRSGSPNLKKLAVAFRKTPAGRKRKK